MYPLPVVLAGCSEKILPQLRLELVNQAADIEFEFRSVTDLLARRSEFRSAVHLFVIHIQDPNDLATLKRLAGAFIGQPFVALLDDGQNRDALICTMRSGASQVVPLPLDSDDFRVAFDCIAMQFSRGAADAKLIAVSGCTGGCGATSLAMNLAYEIAHEHEQRVVLAELSPRIGMLVTYLEAQPKYTFEDLFTYDAPLDVHVVERCLTPISKNLSLLAGSERPLPAGPELTSKVETVLDYLRHLADVVILDLPCTFDESYFQILGLVNRVVLVGEQRIPSVRNLQMVLGSLKLKPGDKKCLIALNRYDSDLEGFTARDLSKLLGVGPITTLANDPTRMTNALNRGQPLRLAAPESPVLADVKALAGELVDAPLQIKVPGKGSGMFGKLFQACGLA